MEHPISGWEWIPNSAIEQAEKELDDSDYPAIRLFNVPLYPSPKRLENLKGGQWEMADRESLAKFSASAWFFAKKLHQELNIPIGIIHSSWGGTSILTWTNDNSLDDFTDSIPRSQSSESYDPQTWEQKVRLSIAGNRGRRNKMSYPDPEILEQLLKPGFSIEGWKAVDMLEKDREYGFVVWMKKEVTLDENQTANELELNLGFLNRQSHVYWNGEELGYFQYPAQVKARVPSSWLKSGTNELTVRLSNQWGRATIHGSPEMFGIKDKAGNLSLPLVTGWKITENLESIPPALPFYVNEPSFLFNGMIAPIIPYGIKGFIWDQGSSDAARPQLYAQLFQRLINDWRRFWGIDDLPFLFVQNTGTHSSHEYHKRSFVRNYLREAQEKALKLTNTGMVVSIDIGDPYDVHPKNKQEFGRRLALQALEKVYNRGVVSDGPYYGSHKVKGDTVIIEVKDATQQLILRCDGENCGFELAGDAGEFFPAHVVLKENALYVFANKVPLPRVIRYAWGDYPLAGVFDSEGLPLGPFRSDLFDNWINRNGMGQSACKSFGKPGPNKGDGKFPYRKGFQNRKDLSQATCGK